MIRELSPTTHHLGLEKIVVRLALRERPDGGAERVRELVVEPAAGGRVEVAWRDPHHEPLRPAIDTERRLAEARRRGLVYPYDAVRLFTARRGPLRGVRPRRQRSAADGNERRRTRPGRQHAAASSSA